MGDTTVNLAGPTERLAVDTARLAALNELERELERSYDPTETGVIDPSYAPGSATTSITTTQRLAHTAGAHAGGTHSTGATAQHVQMPSKLTERAVVEQERMNIVEILRKAIEQDPHRLDLRLKLLELYFSSGLSNREEFVEVARKLSRSGEVLSAADWQKIAALGSPAAANAAQDDKTPGKLADCA
jgi:Tfp pilus assembly protein FimV